MKTKSKYKRKRALHGTETAHKTATENLKHSAIETGKDLLIGVIGGGIVGAVIGKPALLIGVGVTGYGHYAKKPALTTFGIGMMASSGITSGGKTTQGIDGFTAEDVKARIMNFKDSLTSRLFLDKIIKKKDATEQTQKTEETDNGSNGVGEVQYFTYPNQNKELDFSALDNLEKQIHQSGVNYQKSIQGTEEDTMQGNEEDNMQGNEDDTMQGNEDSLDNY
jgi:hypothetical protein